MNATDYENLWNFLGSWFPDADLEGFDDPQVVRNFIVTGNRREIERVCAQGKQVLTLSSLPVEKIASEANRQFENEEACRAWLTNIIQLLDK